MLGRREENNEDYESKIVKSGLCVKGNKRRRVKKKKE